MIQSTKGKRAGDAVQNNYKGFPADLVRRTQALLTALNGAAHINDLRSPPGNRLKKLKDNRQGQYSLRINDHGESALSGLQMAPLMLKLLIITERNSHDH